MGKSSRIFLASSFLLISGFAVSQTQEQDIIERNIEIIAEALEDAEVDYTTLIDDLSAYLERPLDLNSARREELFSLGFLTQIQVNAIIGHRETYGPFITLEELQAVEGLPGEVVRAMRYFTGVNRDVDALKFNFSDVKKFGTHELFLRTDRVVEEQKGYSPITDEELEESPNSRALGSPWRFYTRYRFKYQNRVSIGFTAEKDAGEEFFQGSQKNGFDYFSAHAYISGFGTVDRLAIGDYQVQMGQGLTMWTGLAFGKPADLFSIKRNARGVTPYRSVDENNFLRGAAVTLMKNDFKLTLFGSKKKKDANALTGDTLDAEQAISFSSLQVSGFHRTPGELADKNAVGEKLFGGELKWSHKGFSIGVRASKFILDKEFELRSSDYNQFFLSQNENSVIGADYDYVKGNLNIFGEVARSENGGLAMVNGGYIVLDPKLTFAALHRTYARDFQAVYSNPVAENSQVMNERGLYMGIIVTPNPKLKFSTWVDQYKFPWLKFQTDAPSHGFEVLSQLNYRPTKKLEAYVRFRHRERPKNSNYDDLVIDQVSQTLQHNYRVHLRYAVTETVQLRSRIEVTDYYREGNSQESRGSLIYQDLIIKPKDFPVDLSLRDALFDSETYDSRLYAYEQDVLYFYSIPAHSGVGTRYYAVARYRVMRDLDFWIKWSRWHYRDRDVISSGLSEIQGNIRSDIRMQLRWKF